MSAFARTRLFAWWDLLPRRYRGLKTVAIPHLIFGKRVLVIEDGPTLTHGEIRYGSGAIAAHRYGAAEVVDLRPFAVGTVVETFDRYRWVGGGLPAMGYSDQQVQDLAATLRAIPCDSILVATPVDLARLITLPKPHCRVRYDMEEIGYPDLTEVPGGFLGDLPAHRPASRHDT